LVAEWENAWEKAERVAMQRRWRACQTEEECWVWKELFKVGIPEVDFMEGQTKRCCKLPTREELARRGTTETLNLEKLHRRFWEISGLSWHSRWVVSYGD
jgi:hypothetical protein